MKKSQFEKLGLLSLNESELLMISGGKAAYSPGAGPGGIGPVLNERQVHYITHEVVDFIRGLWEGL